MAATALAETIDALVAGLRAETGYGAPGTDSIIPVFDGPAPTGLAAPKFIVVGDDGDGNTGTETAEWHTLGPEPQRSVDGSVFVLLASWGGTDDAYTAAGVKRGEVASLLAALEKVAHSLEVLPSSVSIEAHYEGAEFSYQATEAGMACQAVARVAYRAILTSWS